MSLFIPQRPSYFVQTGGMHENPYGVPREEIVRFILNNPPEVVAQVVFGKYVESSGLVFQSEIVQRLFQRGGASVINANFWVDREERDRAASLVRHSGYALPPYHTGVDFARQTDFTVITTLDTSTLPARVVYWKRLNRVPWETIYTEVGRAVAIWGPNVLCDSTGMGGDVVMDALESRSYCKKHDRTVMIGELCQDDGRFLGCDFDRDHVALNVCEGYEFGGGTGEKKKRLIEHLRNVMAVGYRKDNPDFGWLRCPPIAQLEEELTFYTWDDKKLVTDCVMSLALAAWSGLEEIVGDPVFGSVYGSW